MPPLHLTKVAFGCSDVDMLRARLAGRAVDGVSHVDTRFRPTRHEELIGGSLYWIIRHQLVARSRILRFDEAGGRCLIRLEAELVPVRLRGRAGRQERPPGRARQQPLRAPPRRPHRRAAARSSPRQGTPRRRR